ncbi:hypothetical protein EDC01DRAFT_642001 [Geopyxis carbonaria]|nr:hypothetical protein EDC01DRAFT_642001 [Geopyxis carbonaria]
MLNHRRITVPPVKLDASDEKKTHHDTPTKAKVVGIIQHYERLGIPHIKRDIFKEQGVAPRTGYRYLEQAKKAKNKRVQESRDPDSDISDDEDGLMTWDPFGDDASRLHNSKRRKETRGRAPKLGWKEIHAMDKIIEDWGIEARQLTWQALAYEAGIEDVSENTIRKAMGTLDYHQCIACRKGYVNPSTAKDRLQFSKVMLERYPDPDDWTNLRFSDTVHFSYGPSLSPRIIRKPGQRYCPKCVVDKQPDEPKETQQEHSWVAVGWNFKSDIVFYDAKSSNHDKMSHDVYVNQILDPVVKPWLQRGDDFVLEEDGDSGHGGRRLAWDPTRPKSRNSRQNIVQKWRRENNLKSYFTCHNSPDLSPVESCWQGLGPNTQVKKVGHFDSETTRELVCEGWAAVSQEHINKQVESMPQRFRDCIERDGNLTGW